VNEGVEEDQLLAVVTSDGSENPTDKS
jgi:hypothetical protein